LTPSDVKSLIVSEYAEALSFGFSNLVNVLVNTFPGSLKLPKAISRMTEIPFVPAFSQKTDKAHLGRLSSLNQSGLKFLKSWNTRNGSILFVDDCITSGIIPPSAGPRDHGRDGKPRGWTDLGQCGRVIKSFAFSGYLRQN